jgi:hypothetical protein
MGHSIQEIERRKVYKSQYPCGFPRDGP